jgi:hypothetical protein
MKRMDVVYTNLLRKILEINMSTSINRLYKRVPVTFLVMALLVPMTSHASTFITTFNTGTFFEDGGCFSRIFNRRIGSGFRAANVQLSGFDMSYTSGDHHIRRSSMKIARVAYDPISGNVAFTVSGCFHDKNGDDDFTWSADISIVGDQF